MQEKTRLIIALCIFSIAHSLPHLSDFRHSVYSQWGEDGIISKIFEIIGTGDKICVEFGAADGFWYSNTANLWTHDSSWRAYLIEADQRWFDKLVMNMIAYPHVMPLFARVGIEEEHSLARILGDIGGAIDLLSIDIDSNDCYILATIEKLQPRVIICEYNPTIPVTVDMRGTYGPSNTVQSSAGTLKKVAEAIGYRLVALTTTNAFFVREEDFEKFANFETDIEKIDVNKDYYRYVIQTSDGKYLEIQPRRVPWSPNGSMYAPYTFYREGVEGDVFLCNR